jgi:murein hydrolase activator
MGNTIIIKHGDYFTVYTGLKDIAVKQGQQVSTNQNLGAVVVNGEGISELRFQIRKNFDALDPQEWLKN